MLLIKPSLVTGLFRTSRQWSQCARLVTRLCQSTSTKSEQACHSGNALHCAVRTSSRTTTSANQLSLLHRLSPYSRNIVVASLLSPCHTVKCCRQIHTCTERNRRLSCLGQHHSNLQSVRCCLQSVLSGDRRSAAPLSVRWMSSSRSSRQNAWKERNKSVMLYVIAGAILVVGFSYAAVPLYTVFCQATGLGGQATAGHDTEKVEKMAAVTGRELVIRFNADTAASMRWNFRPQQSEVKVVPGETALAFYSAMNPTDKPIVGISTYNVVPFEAGQYFNKIQCFCFEEQRLNPHEQVDMPVFFYIDPDFDDDPKMAKVTNITLSYTFFESKEGLELPDPMSR